MRAVHSHLGSGTVPYTVPGIEGGILNERDGESVAVINPEDFSVYRGGNVKQVSLTANVVARLDTTLANRRAVAIQNMDSSNDLYIGFTSSVTLSGATGGWKIPPSGEITINATNRLHIFGISASNIVAGVMEVS